MHRWFLRGSDLHERCYFHNENAISCLFFLPFAQLQNGNIFSGKTRSHGTKSVHHVQCFIVEVRSAKMCWWDKVT